MADIGPIYTRGKKVDMGPIYIRKKVDIGLIYVRVKEVHTSLIYMRVKMLEMGPVCTRLQKVDISHVYTRVYKSPLKKCPLFRGGYSYSLFCIGSGIIILISAYMTHLESVISFNIIPTKYCRPIIYKAICLS